ncbi:MAG: hypothetical protein MMC23_000398 [Stictis urceolatum]|nr:hypothetical protein [Stictis urceolata]
MPWAAGRKTTKVEDTASCLLGLFNVNLILLYGEGQHAFFRLQKKIMKQSNDHSILAWNLSKDENRGLLAQFPDELKGCSSVVPLAVAREHSVIGIYLALLSGIVQFAGVREDGRDRVRFDSALLESSRYRRVYVKQNKKMNGFQFRKFNIFHDGFRIARSTLHAFPKAKIQPPFILKFGLDSDFHTWCQYGPLNKTDWVSEDSYLLLERWMHKGEKRAWCVNRLQPIGTARSYKHQITMPYKVVEDTGVWVVDIEDVGADHRDTNTKTSPVTATVRKSSRPDLNTKTAKTSTSARPATGPRN